MFNQIILISEAVLSILMREFSTPVSSLPINSFLLPEGQMGQMQPASKGESFTVSNNHLEQLKSEKNYLKFYSEIKIPVELLPVTWISFIKSV